VCVCVYECKNCLLEILATTACLQERKRSERYADYATCGASTRANRARRHCWGLTSSYTTQRHSTRAHVACSLQFNHIRCERLQALGCHQAADSEKCSNTLRWQPYNALEHSVEQLQTFAGAEHSHSSRQCLEANI
jgi:hypothetical protein